MLRDDFYTLKNVNEDGSLLIALNPHHEIFNGHFPNQPVVPGVCLMQMVKETLEEITQQKVRLSRASALKFISPIDPVKNPLLLLRLNHQQTAEKEIKVSGSIEAEETVCFKFQSVFSCSDV